MRETVLLDHKDPKVQVVVETNVLDFGYLNIEEIESLKTKEPWGGIRKKIEEEKEEDDEKQPD